VVRILVGSGVRISELCGIAVEGPDGMPDLILDSMERAPVERDLAARASGPTSSSTQRSWPDDTRGAGRHRHDLAVLRRLGAGALGLRGQVQDQAMLAVLAGYVPGAQQ